MATRTMKPNSTEDPWTDIHPDPDRMLGRRVDGEHALGIYWVVSADHAPGLLVRGIGNASVPRVLPRPRGIALRVASEGDQVSQLSLFLLSSEDREVFLELCRDVIAYSSEAPEPAGAAASLFRRIEQWQSLLSQGRVAEFGPQEIRGLMGELWLLDQFRQRIGMRAALSAWVAPDEHPQDFALQAFIVEVKTRLGGSRQMVSISSLEQLETSHLPLHLLVVELAPGQADALSLNDMATSALAHAKTAGKDVEEQAAASLLRRGYIASPRYDELRYVASGVRLFAVGEGFPKMVRSTTDQRITTATYCIDLTTLTQFEHAVTDVLSPATEH
jgi:hypothetical protein